MINLLWLLYPIIGGFVAGLAWNNVEKDTDEDKRGAVLWFAILFWPLVIAVESGIFICSLCRRNSAEK